MRGFTGPIEEIILSVSRLSFSDLSSRLPRSRSKCVSILSFHSDILFGACVVLRFRYRQTFFSFMIERVIK